MARRNIVDDSEWPEVMVINGYAVFMGYLMMGVRGLGVLVITWTTVVLLGGFVSVLGMKDFWCLTVITLVQTAGVFNIVLEETISDFVRSLWGLLGTAYATVIKSFKKRKGSFRYYLAFLISGIQALVLVIILCPVAVLYVFGIYISAGAGLSRLIQHDFGNADGSPNLKPALQVLYSLTAAQGVLYGYKTIHAYGAKVGLAEFVAKKLLLMDEDLVSAYLKDTVEGCEKDPSFGTGRNLVTYAVELMLGTKSNGSFINGVKILGTAAIQGQPDRQVLAKHLLTRPSSSLPQMIQGLLETMGPSSPYNGEIRGQAAAILSVVASSIHLEEHPGWINCISSLLETFEEYSWQLEKYERDSDLPEDYERSWLLASYEVTYWLFKDDKKKSRIDNTTTMEDSKRRDCLRLVQKGLSILGNLSVHQDNCRVIIDTEGLLPKIMAPLKSEQMLRDDRHVWHSTARESYKVMKQLAVIPGGETGAKIRGEISRSREAIITTLECILECLDCDIELKISTVDIVLHLSVDTSSIKTSGSCGRIFTWIVQLIYHIPYDVNNEIIIKKTSISRYSSRLADQEILSWNQELPLQQSVGYVFRDLTAALVSDEDISTKRVQAAQILRFLIFWCGKDDEFLKELKKTMVSVMLEVLKEIHGRGSTGEAETKAANNIQPSSSQEVDMEMGGVSGEGEDREQASSSQQQAGDEIGDIKRLRKELTELCSAIHLWWYKSGEVTRELDAIAEKISSEQGKPGKTFKELVKEQEKKYRVSRPEW